MSPKHSPGGKVKLRLKDGVTGTAQFGGENNEYRYRLTRTWEADKPYALFVLMNPSMADAEWDDPTIAKCCRFAEAWEFGGVAVANTFAYCRINQARLTETPYPVGPENDKHIVEMAKQAGLVVFAYGKPRHKQLRSRGPALARMLIEAGVVPHVSRLNKDGTPSHPLYLRETLKPVIWESWSTLWI